MNLSDVIKPYCGFLLLHKPEGITSHAVLHPIKRRFRGSKIGHAGTLDQDASGLLIIGVGAATRLLSQVEAQYKIYEFTLHLGLSTTTLDATGEPIDYSNRIACSAEQLQTALLSFMGDIDQVPPAYSALKIDGKRASDRVRSGETVQMHSRQVHIFELEILHPMPSNHSLQQPTTQAGNIEHAQKDVFRSWRLRCKCSKGTYIRSLARDIGHSLGSSAFVSAIARTHIGNHSVQNAQLPSQEPVLYTVCEFMPQLAVCRVDGPEYSLLKQGIRLTPNQFVLESMGEQTPENIIECLVCTPTIADAICYAQIKLDGNLYPKIQFPSVPVYSKGIAVVTGNFDGLHIGHAHLIREMKILAKGRGLQPLVISFDPHTSAWHQEMTVLTTVAEKHEIIKQEFDIPLKLLPFTEGMRNLPAQDFLQKIIVKELQAKLWVLGFDHRFGKGGAGSYESMNHCCAELGLEMVQGSEYKENDQVKKIGSGVIRDALRAGDIALANKWLGRPYALLGKVVRGDGIGKQIGFPTANLQFPKNKLIPRLGVYAGYAQIKQKTYKAVINIGTRPTVGGVENRFEVHILDFSEKIYGQDVWIKLNLRIRDEEKFGSVELLQKQIQQDIERTIENLY
jgi:riboflavin kinase / FMN adenylyltransferase